MGNSQHQKDDLSKIDKQTNDKITELKYNMKILNDAGQELKQNEINALHMLIQALNDNMKVLTH